MFDKKFLEIVDQISDIFIDFMEEKGFDVDYHDDKYFGNGATAIGKGDKFVPIFKLSNQIYPKIFALFVEDRNGNDIIYGNYVASYTFSADNMNEKEIISTFKTMLNDIYVKYGTYNKSNRLDFTYKGLIEDRKSYTKKNDNKKLLATLQDALSNYIDNCTEDEWKKILNDYCIEDNENYMGEVRTKLEEVVLDSFNDMDKESIEMEINKYSKYLNKEMEM